MTRRIDPNELRTALGSFVTGVTVVTAEAPDGQPVGLTVNSFNSVSLDPPLVSWCLARASSKSGAFAEATHFAVNVLAADQRALSVRFSEVRDDHFDGLDIETGLGGAPLLAGCVARFQCEVVDRHAGGDHVLFIGRVLAFDRADRPPLLYHRGEYGVSMPHPETSDP
jgi:flavin reductase (DIM6/NTAB) family NADH-FMN oxidoreductase RutF